jgi:hypothetical protein
LTFVHQVFSDVHAARLVLYDHKESLRYEGFPKDDMGGIKILRLSTVSERLFCIDCHSSLGMRYSIEPDSVSITLGSVDEGTIVSEEVRKGLTPFRHIFWSQKVFWFEGNDGLLRFDRFPGTFEERLNAAMGKED